MPFGKHILPKLKQKRLLYFFIRQKLLLNEVFLFAGDKGAFDSGIMNDKTNNITLIVSGIAGRKEDDFVIARIANDCSVSFNLI